MNKTISVGVSFAPDPGYALAVRCVDGRESAAEAVYCPRWQEVRRRAPPVIDSGLVPSITSIPAFWESDGPLPASQG
jgi:hypothetical protein